MGGGAVSNGQNDMFPSFPYQHFSFFMFFKGGERFYVYGAEGLKDHGPLRIAKYVATLLSVATGVAAARPTQSLPGLMVSSLQCREGLNSFYGRS